MFGKILVLFAVVAAVYFGYRYLTQRDAIKKAEEAERLQKRGGSQDMAKCRVCGDYVAPGTGPCGKASCPF